MLPECTMKFSEKHKNHDHFNCFKQKIFDFNLNIYSNVAGKRVEIKIYTIFKEIFYQKIHSKETFVKFKNSAFVEQIVFKSTKFVQKLSYLIFLEFCIERISSNVESIDVLFLVGPKCRSR